MVKMETDGYAAIEKVLSRMPLAIGLIIVIFMVIPVSASASDNIIINEIMFDPVGDDAGNEWIELYNNGTEAQNINGWTISNRTGEIAATLPDWDFPNDTYLVVHFGTGINDSDFSDGSGSFYTGVVVDIFNNTEDEVALYNATPSVLTIIDFVSYCFDGEYSSGVAHDYSVSAGIWDSGDFFSGLVSIVYPRRQIIFPGESIGRDKNSTDTNQPEDWDGDGGKDAIASTPGVRNLHKLGIFVKQPIDPPPPKNWTFMVYVAGDNNLEKMGFVDIDEMEQVGSDDNINIVFQFDGFKKVHEVTISDGERVPVPNTYGKAFRGYLKQQPVRDPTLVYLYPAPDGIYYIDEVNMGDPTTLTNFVQWGITNFPADNYALIIWDHGDGWKGVAEDMASGDDRLYMGELKDALDPIPVVFDILGFDACLMGMIEVGYQVYQDADILVASEECEEGEGWPYNTTLAGLKANPGWDGTQLATRIVNDYHTYYTNNPDPDHTLSAIRLGDDFLDLVTVTSDFGYQLRDGIEDYDKDFTIHYNPDDNVQIKIRGEKAATEHYDDANYIDLRHFAEKIRDNGEIVDKWKNKAPDIVNLLAKGGPVVIAEEHGPGHPNSCGLSIYFPTAQKKDFNLEYPFDNPWPSRISTPASSLAIYAEDKTTAWGKVPDDHPYPETPNFDFPLDTQWDEFLHRYYKPCADAGEDETVFVGETVIFNGSGSSDSDGSIIKWFWDFDATTSSDTEDCDKDGVDEKNDDNEAEGVQVEKVFNSPGVYNVTLTVWDDHQQVEKKEHWKTDQDTVVIVVNEPPEEDMTPPTTTKEYGTPYYTDGVNEWVTSDTPIYLTATDEGSGVAYTKYRVWYNGEWTEWLTYTGPFTMKDIGVEKDCLHKIEWYSVDNAGNEETWEEVAVEANAGKFEAYSAIAVDPFALNTIHMVYTEGGSEDLIYETSSDFGVTWTGRTVLVSGLDEASEPDIKTAPNGDIHVVFHGNEISKPQRIYHIWYNFSKNDYSYDNTIDPDKWEDRVLVNDAGRDNVHPQIAIDSLNIVHCVWIGDSDGFIEGGAQDIFYSKFNESGWSSRLTLYANVTITPDKPNPQIIADRYNSLHVVFLDSNEHKMKYLTYHVPIEFIPLSGDDGDPMESEWGSYFGGNWNNVTADNVGNSSASYGTIAGMAIEEDILHIAWQDVRNGEGQVYENTRDIMTTDAFGHEWQITSGPSIDNDGTSVGEVIMESGEFDNLHLFYRDSIGYDIWYMEHASVWTTPAKVADSGPKHVHLWSDMAVDNFDSPLLSYTKATNDYTEYDIHYKKPYHNQIFRVDNKPPTTTKTVGGSTYYGPNGEEITTETEIILDAKDNCHCEKWAILVAGPDSRKVVADGFKKQVEKMEEMLKQKCKTTDGWKIEKLTGSAATKDNIEKAFKKVQAREGKCCQLFFYFKDHGSGYHKTDGYAGGRIDMTCKGEPGEKYNEKDFNIRMTQKKWDGLAEGGGCVYDTDGDGKPDMIFGKHNGVATLTKGEPSNWDWDNPIGKDTDGIEYDHERNKYYIDIDKDDDGADLNGDGDTNDTFCIDEDMSLAGPNVYDDDLAQYINWTCKCKNTVIVLDCCFSGGFVNDITRKNPSKPMVIVTSAPEDDYAYARVTRDKITGKIVTYHGNFYSDPFRQELMKCLSVEQAHKRAQEEIKKLKDKSEFQGPVPPEPYDSDKKENKFLCCCGVGSYQIHYRIWYDGEWGPEQVGELNQPVTFKFAEDCKHIIEYWAVDDLGNEEEHHFQTHYVACVPAFTPIGCILTLLLLSGLGTIRIRKMRK